MPEPYFPASILQRGLKMTSDRPRGIKANLQRTYINIINNETVDDREVYMSNTKEPLQKKRVWCNLLLSLSLFHAVVLERRKFGPHGWNIPYEFADADLTTSIAMLKNFLMENQEIPWDSIKFMTGQINYGGRVTDDLDRILLTNTLEIFYNEYVITSTEFRFS
jgi:dynein heavy chain